MGYGPGREVVFTYPVLPVCHVHIPETQSMHGYSWIPHCNWKSIVSLQITSVLYSGICTNMLLSVFDLFQIPNKIGPLFLSRWKGAGKRHRQQSSCNAGRPLQLLHRDTRGPGKTCETNVFAPLNSKSALPNARTIIGFSSSLPRWLWNCVLYISLRDNPNQFNLFLVDKMLRTECPTGFHG